MKQTALILNMSPVAFAPDNIEKLNFLLTQGWSVKAMKPSATENMMLVILEESTNHPLPDMP